MSEENVEIVRSIYEAFDQGEKAIRIDHFLDIPKAFEAAGLSE